MSTTVAPIRIEAATREVLAPRRTRRRHPARWILPAYTAFLLLFLALPILTMVLYGFNDVPGERQTPRFWGFTLTWYRTLFDDPSLNQSVRNSITIALVSAILATPLGTLLGLSLGRYGFRGKAAVSFVIFMAIAIPEIVLGSSLLSMFVQLQEPLGFTLGFPTILLSHIAFGTPFVAVTVRARVQGMDRSLEDAAQDLFATPFMAFVKVTLPIIMPGITAGFMLAFVLSLDDFVITNFVSGQMQTFPIWVYGATRIGLPPTVNVFGTLLFGAGVLLAVVSALSRRRDRAP
jgi:spermidine/putrescine transport system permease protein